MANTNQTALDILIAKDEIRELVLLYSRGVDRQDPALLRTLYTKDGTDHHGKYFKGSADDYVAFLAKGLPNVHMSAHHVCNHLIAVNGDEGEGEVYALAYHVYPDGKGAAIEDIMCVRYVDRYRKEDGRWRFAARVVTFDHQTFRPMAMPEEKPTTSATDPSYTTLSLRLFGRGPRT